jgi:class 3 adenylate cyclase/tetratricopeptide (TPR) repeat protein
LTPGARFCAYCGTQITEFHEQAERRLVTVAFFDMVGSTPIAEQMDPEEFRDLVLAYQDVCVAAIEAEGGYVADYRGDGVFAYFGYPLAHEDDAERAVRAGLRARERIGQAGAELQVRAGMHTGLVVVGEMGAGSRRKHDVVTGDAANVASRIQALAGPGEVLISQETLELAHGAFVIEDLGTPELKGITRSIRLFRVVRESDSPAPMSVVLTPLVDRKPEVAELTKRFKRASNGSGQVVVLEGEPGVGKSRLVYTFRDLLADTDHDWIEVVAAATNRLSPLRAVIEAVRTRAQLDDDDSDDIQLLRFLIGLSSRELDLTPQVRRRRTMEALSRWFLGLAVDRPLVLVVEDLHWLDPTTMELLASLGERTEHERVFLLATTRGGPSPWLGNPRCTVLHLKPLVAQDAAELAGSIARGLLSEETIADVVVRTDGIPLFVEEITRAVVEGDTTMIPTSLHQSLAARLDRLGDAREIAQVAAVVGRDFDGKLLASVLNTDEAAIARHLPVLVDAGVVEESFSAPDDVAVFRFRHALLRDVAYESLLRTRRRTLHARVAGVLGEFLPDLPGAQPEVVAHHYSEAGEVRSAVDFWTRAAQRASERYALTEAIEHATKAIEGVRELEPSDERNQWELGLIFMLNRFIVQSSGPHDARNEQIFLRACELTASKSELSLEHFTARSGLCAYYIGHARFGEAMELATQLAEVAQRAGRRTFLMSTSSWLGDTHYHRGEFQDALRCFREALALYRPDRDMAASEFIGFDFGVNAHLHIAYVQWYLGDATEATAALLEAKELAEQLPFGFPLCHVLVARAILHALGGETSAAMDYADQATAMATEHEWWLMSGQAAFAKGRALWLAGEPGRSAFILREAVEKLLQPGGFGGATMALTWLAEAQLDAGDIESAAVTARRAEDIIDRTGERFFEAELRRVNARVLATAEKESESAEELHRAIAIAHAQGNVASEEASRRQLTTGRAGT